MASDDDDGNDGERRTSTITASHVAPLDPQPPGLTRGEPFGRYLVLERLGAGGMGVVYSAYDPELDRRIAVKIMRPEAVQDQSRLRREAQAMARLQHPNVVAVYDAGMVDERAFVAMELVDGATLAQWLDAESRTWREIVDIYLNAGRGLSAAHAMGLVHRDFKPANVLVGRDGRVRVSDFGLARSSDADDTSADVVVMDAAYASSSRLDEPVTRTGVLVGTPTYMSPEQFSGTAMSVQSDQFSFCVALYRALYRERPFAGDTVAALSERLAKGRSPTPPKDSRVPSWVRDAVLRGLSIDPAQRWPSMDALLQALQRNPERRHRRWLIAGGALAALTVVAVGGRALYQHQRQVCRGSERQLAGLWDDGRKQAVHAAFVASGSSSADAAFASVADALDRFAGKWVAMKTEACEATRIHGTQSEELLDLRMQCLDSRLQEARATVALFTSADAPLIVKAPSMADSLANLGACADVAALRSPVRPPADAATRARVDALSGKLAQLKALQRASRFKEGLPLAVAAVAEARDIKYRPIEAQALLLLATLQTQAGDTKAAQQSNEEAVLAAHAGRDLRQEALADAALLSLAAGAGKFEEGQIWEQRGLASVEALGGTDRDPEAALLMRASDLYAYRGDFEGALQRDRRFLAIREKNDGPQSVATATAHAQLGRELVALGHYQEAEPELRGAVAVMEKQLGPSQPLVAWALTSLATIENKTRHLDQSKRTLERVVDIDEKIYGREHLQLAVPLSNLGAAYLMEGQNEKSLQMSRRALAITLKAYGPEHTSVALAYLMLGDASMNLKRLPEAREYLDKALAIYEKVFPGDNVLLGAVLTSDALVLIAQHHPEQALALMQRAMKTHTDTITTEGLRKYVLGAAMWDAGKDRVRARQLVEEGRAVYPNSKEYAVKAETDEIDQWLASHPLPH